MKKMLRCLGMTLCLCIAFAWNTSAFGQGLTIYTEEYGPWNYTMDGQITGMATEIVQEIMNRTGNNYPIQSVPWARGYSALVEEPNVMLYSTVRTREREELGLQWVGPLGMLRNVFLQKSGADNNIESFEDARKVGKIGVYADTVFEQTLRSAEFENLEVVHSAVLAMRMLMAGRVDLVMLEEGAALMIAQDEGFDPDGFEVAFVYEEMPMYLAFSRQTDASIVAEWDQAFQAMLNDGTAQEISDRYFAP